MAYEINININGEVEDSIQGISETQSIGSPQKNSSIDASKLGKYIASQTIEPFISKTKDYVVSNVELTTGSRAIQDKVNFAMEGVQLGINAYKNAQAGAIITSSLGMGSGVGIAIGLTLTAISTTMNIIFKQAEIDLKRREEDYQRSYLYSRSGIAYSQSRRGQN